MHAIQITSPGQIDIVELPQASPGPGEVSIRITGAGICGTDVHLFSGRFGEFPMVPGHDLVGVIETVGEGVAPGRMDERVTVDPAACCTRAAVVDSLCAACRRGATNLCEQAAYMGVSAPGGMAEHVIVPSSRAIALPETLDDAAATVLEPVAVGLHLLRKLEDRSGDVLVIGGGAIGIAAGLLLQLEGRQVTISEPLESRRKLLRLMGLKRTRAPEELDPHDSMPIVVETSGHPSAAKSILDHAASGATIVLVGGDTTIPGISILTHEWEVRAVKGGCGLYPEAVRMIAGGQLDLRPLISHRFGVREAARAFELAAARPDLVTRVFLDLTAWPPKG